MSSAHAGTAVIITSAIVVARTLVCIDTPPGTRRPATLIFYCESNALSITHFDQGRDMFESACAFALTAAAILATFRAWTRRAKAWMGGATLLALASAIIWCRAYGAEIGIPLAIETTSLASLAFIVSRTERRPDRQMRIIPIGLRDADTAGDAPLEPGLPVRRPARLEAWYDEGGRHGDRPRC